MVSTAKIPTLLSASLEQDNNAHASRQLVTISHYDSQYRPRLTRTLENPAAGYPCSDEGAGIKVETRYRSGGGYARTLVSNPFRAVVSGQAGGESTMGWTLYLKDAAGRDFKTQWFSGAAAPDIWGGIPSKTGEAMWAYDGRKTTGTDAADKVRRLYLDPLGRLGSVEEQNGASIYLTSYGWDARDNLISVNQGAQARTFQYDSLSRLTASVSPEQGGNARKQITGRTYNAGTPSVTYGYDASGVPFSKGRLTSVSSTVSSTAITGYDKAGRITSSQQTTAGATYPFAYTWYRNDSLGSITYPSGKTVFYPRDGAGRTAAVTRPGIDYVWNANYAPHGSIASLQRGIFFFDTWTFNGRLQPTDIRVGSQAGGTNWMHLVYTYGMWPDKNNGNLRAQQIFPQGVTQVYDYDGLNRINLFQEGSGTQSYDYDQHGNWWVSQNYGMVLHPRTPVNQNWYNAANNRLAFEGYDAAGNQTTFSPYTLSYDAENRIMSATSSQNGSASYAYDGEGRRVTRIVCSGSAPCTDFSPNAARTTFVYDAMGNLAVENNASDPAAQGQTQSVLTDALGSTRLTVNIWSGYQKRFDYTPFGEYLTISGRGEWYGYLRPDEDIQFTGQQRDAETGLDYFGARYYSGAQGRWTSPDPINITWDRLGNPGNTLNKYVYAANNPLKFTDSDGQDITLFYKPSAASGDFDDFGHAFLAAYDQSKNQVDFLDYYPAERLEPQGLELVGPSAVNTGTFNERRSGYASLTIQTTPGSQGR